MPFTSQGTALTHTGFENMRDQGHASYVFRPNQYANSPRRKFLFHVHFTLNTGEIPELKNAFGGDWPVISLLVKTVELPKFKVKTDVLNQYNRKRVVQSKLEYEPISVEFHDDAGDSVRKLWYYYYTYYYKDASHRYGNSTNRNGVNGNNNADSNGFDYNNRDIYDADLLASDWGFSGESYKDGVLLSSKPAFFRDVRIYGFDQSRFAEYVLINPLITQWQGDTYDYAEDAGIMSQSMTLEYETVKYYSGKIDKTGRTNPVLGFPNESYYDNAPSPLSGSNWEEELGPGRRSDLETRSFASTVGAPQQATVNNTQGIRTANEQALPTTSVPGQSIRSAPGSVTPVVGNGPLPVQQSGAGVLAPADSVGVLPGQARPQPNQQGLSVFDFPRRRVDR